jgi:hypothetical protein
MCKKTSTPIITGFWQIVICSYPLFYGLCSMVMAFGAIYELSAEQRYAELNTFYEKTHLRDITVNTYAQQRNANKI